MKLHALGNDGCGKYNVGTRSIPPTNDENDILDLVELHFRDQYFSRGDMYTLSQELHGMILHTNERLHKSRMRVSVGDLWFNGCRLDGGKVGCNTKFVFRSDTAVIHIFLQMSNEMWVFDDAGDAGDLYFEKAIHFLSDLLLKFQPARSCSHDITLVLFTRVFIDGVSPACLHLISGETNGNYYEDYYCVVVQHERYTTHDWRRELSNLKVIFKTYLQDLRTYILQRYSPSINGHPVTIRISSASDGNLLETLNMVLNLYAGYNVNRNVDRTGKMSFLVTPGNGYFHVEPHLYNLTQQRILDSGVGIDLICLGQQPLHSVPLFELYKSGRPENYVFPFWINCSFYRSPAELMMIESGLPVIRTQVRVILDEKLKSSPTAPSSTDIPHSPPVQQIIYPQIRSDHKFDSTYSFVEPLHSNNKSARVTSSSGEYNFSPASTTSVLNVSPVLALKTADHVNQDRKRNSSSSSQLSPGLEKSIIFPPTSVPDLHATIDVMGSKPSHATQPTVTLPSLVEDHSEVEQAIVVVEKPSQLRPQVKGGAGMLTLPGGLKDRTSQHHTSSESIRSKDNMSHLTSLSSGLNSTSQLCSALSVTVDTLDSPRRRASLCHITSPNLTRLQLQTSSEHSSPTTSAILSPIRQSHSPFTSSHSQPPPVILAGQRRWCFARPMSTDGTVVNPHEDASGGRSWKLPPHPEATFNYIDVWDTYFSSYRKHLEHRAPGSPPSMMYIQRWDQKPYSSSTASLTTASLHHTKNVYTHVQNITRPLPSTRISSPYLDNTSHSSGEPVSQLPMDTTNTSRSVSDQPIWPKIKTDGMDIQKSNHLDRVLNLLEIDWKSVTSPACLPVHTDFFPDMASLKSESYAFQDYRVVPVGVSVQEWQSTHDFERQPGYLYCRRPLTVREVFHEMILQRLCHGFQLCDDHPPVVNVDKKTNEQQDSIVSTNKIECSATTRETSRSFSIPQQTNTRNTMVPRSAQAKQRHSRFSWRQSHFATQGKRVSAPTTTSTQMVSQGSTPTTIRTVGLGFTAMPSLGNPDINASRGSAVTTSSADSSQVPTVTQPITEKTTVKLSIGCSFHSLTLEDDSITLTIHRFRQEDTPIHVDYKYALKVPDTRAYQPLHTTFTNVSANMLNWSHLDNYLCTRGVNDSYGLLPSLKFWRCRFMLLPVFSQETKRLTDAIKSSKDAPIFCDVYESNFNSLDQNKMSEKFVHFIQCINRIRSAQKLIRQIVHDKPKLPGICPRDQSTPSHKPEVIEQSKPNTTPSISSTRSSVQVSNLTREPANTSVRLNSFDDNSAKSPLIYSAISVDIPSDETNSCISVTSHSTPAIAIALMMADPNIGLPFVVTCGVHGLPEHTFISYDAVNWVLKWVTNVTYVSQAVAFIQTLVESGWICHTSGNPSHAFIHGTYLYTLLVPHVKTSAAELPTMSVSSTPVTPIPPMTSDTSGHSTSLLSLTKVEGGQSNSSLQQSAMKITPIDFPENYIPRATLGESGRTADFQTNWVEVAMAYDPLDAALAGDNGKGGENDVAVERLSACSPSGYVTEPYLTSVCGEFQRSGVHDNGRIPQKSCICDFDDLQSGTSGHAEWSHFIYDANFHPQCGFQFELQWLVASGVQVKNLIDHCKTKATGFHLFPIPFHPFGRSSVSCDMDPLRCPIFIPMNVEYLLRKQAGLNSSSPLTQSESSTKGSTLTQLACALFPAYIGKRQTYILRVFQQYLLQRFGFLRDTYDADQSVNLGGSSQCPLPSTTANWNYIHCSGGMFTIIPAYEDSSETASSDQPLASASIQKDHLRSPVSNNPTQSTNLQTPFTRKEIVVDSSKCLSEHNCIGYFWFWNHMLPRRWSDYHTGDVHFQDTILADFRAFMSGSGNDDRLQTAFKQFTAQLVPVETQSDTAPVHLE